MKMETKSAVTSKVVITFHRIFGLEFFQNEMGSSTLPPVSVQ